MRPKPVNTRPVTDVDTLLLAIVQRLDYLIDLVDPPARTDEGEPVPMTHGSVQPEPTPAKKAAARKAPAKKTAAKKSPAKKAAGRG